MPNVPIIDLSVNCPSNCSLLGTSSVMRNFLLSKNLPNIPTDVITAGLITEWYNNGNVAPAYEVIDPVTLVDQGNVLSDINNWKTKHANINLYDDYSDEHYNPTQFPNYTQYPLISIDDSIAAVTFDGFGNVEAWTDMDEALIQTDTWDSKWLLELQNNRYSPSDTYFNFPSLPNHTDNIIPDIAVTTTNIMSQYLTTQHNISGFITTANPNSIYTPILYYQTFLESNNKYKQSANNSYYPAYFGTAYFNFSDPTLTIPNLIINQTDDSIDEFTDEDGTNIMAFPTPTPHGVREWYETTYNDFSINNTYNPSGIGFYSNGNVDFMPVGDTSDGFLPNNDLKDELIDSIDGFIIDVPDFSSLGFTSGEQLTPVDIRGGYCAYENIYGGTSSITENVEILPSDSPIYQYNTTPKVLNCYGYITSVIDPFTYGIQDSKEVSSNILNPENLLQEYLPPQATINVGVNSPMDLTRYGVTSTVQSALGFVLPNMPVPLDAVLNQIDKNAKDTPLGKTARVKLASEFFNRVALNARQDAYGMAEQIGNGLVTLAGNLVKSVVGSDRTQSGLDIMVGAFKNYEITVPKSIIGRAANFVSSLAGTNLKLDPIKEAISWTSYIEKTDDDLNLSLINEEPTGNKRSFWSKLGLGTPSKTNDPSEILIAYTSNGQRQFLSNSLKLNDYYPYYQISGYLDDGDNIYKKQRKLNRLQRKLKNNNSRKKNYEERKNKVSDTITEIYNSDSSSGEYKNKIRRLINGKCSGAADPTSCAKRQLEDDELKEFNELNNKISAIETDNKQIQNAIDTLKIKAPDGWYPVVDNGTFFGTYENSQIKSVDQLTETHPDIDTGSIKMPIRKKDFQEYKNASNKTYEHPIDKKNDVSRYRRNPTLGLSSEDEPRNEEIYNIYQKVTDLLKHGPKLNDDDVDLRGLNINSLDKPNIGYNVYPYLENSADNILHHPGLGREDIYEGQSLFSVLERNGFVKISPLWGGDGYGDQTQSLINKRKIIEKGFNGDVSETYKERIKIHRYMFSLENLAWKGYDQQLPWWERGPNGGRIMWFPPYDIRISDTTSVSLGQENLIGRNEPIYTYNHSERSGVLSFKMIMDFPGYHDSNTKYTEPQTQATTQQQVAQSVTDSMTVLALNAPKSEDVDWDITSDTYIYIFLDQSESMQSYSETVKSLFVGPNALFKTKLINDGIYTEDTYNKQVFVFYDPGYLAMGDNLDDGRLFSWFASPHFMAQNIDTTNNTITYTNEAGLTQTHTVPSMVTRLKTPANVASNNLDKLNLITTTPQKVICIATVNESSPAYLKRTPDGNINYSTNLSTANHTPQPNGSGVCRLFADISDFITAKQNGYTGSFKGIVLGYDANLSGDIPRDLISNDLFALFCTNMFGGIAASTTSEISQLNNIGIAWPNTVNYQQNVYNFVWTPPTTPQFGDFNQTTPQTIPDRFDDFKYILEIGADGNIDATAAEGENTANNVVYVIKKALSVNPMADIRPITKSEQYTHNSLPKLREYFYKMAYDNPNHTTVINGEKLVWDTSPGIELSTKQVRNIVGPNDGNTDNTYDVELWKLFTKNTNKKNIEEFTLVYPSVSTPNVLVISDDGTQQTIFEWLQTISGSNGFDNQGNFTSDGWKSILKYINGGSEPTNESIAANNVSSINPQTDQDANQIKWGINIDNMTPDNQLNEFLYFKRLEKSDDIFYDKFKDKIKFFDPAFHSITPVGFNNRLNFLEQCARQGPSINNSRSLDGNFINANSNLAFGRPPISVLRIGDFYHTRIAIEGVDLSYEPLLFDLNPEGIGVQPMVVDVVINFKYLGGSSLSGPITELQNAVSNNYFANVEFYNTQALKAFDRFKKPITSENAKSEEIYYGDNSSGSLAFDEPLSTEFDTGFADGDGSSNGGTTNKDKENEKNGGKDGATNSKCVCPEGYLIHGILLSSDGKPVIYSSGTYQVVDYGCVEMKRRSRAYKIGIPTVLPAYPLCNTNAGLLFQRGKNDADFFAKVGIYAKAVGTNYDSRSWSKNCKSCK